MIPRNQIGSVCVLHRPSQGIARQLAFPVAGENSPGPPDAGFLFLIGPSEVNRTAAFQVHPG
jgi:hypothetical protein